MVSLKCHIAGEPRLPVPEDFIELETETDVPVGCHLNRHSHIQAIQKHKQALDWSERVDVSEWVDRSG